MDGQKNLFFIDAETDGLYGGFISVAVIVIDYQYHELERHYWGISKDHLNIQSPWVLEHVMPFMEEYESCQNEEEMLSKVWSLWEKYRENTYAVADVCYPVETRLFEKCIQMNPKDREFKGPFPLLDLSSVLYAKGMDPLVDRELMVKSPHSGKHNALHDVEMTIETWKAVNKA